ncbi:hypothetical protein BN1723_020019, partial [Verticillium longisporum]
MAVGVL